MECLLAALLVATFGVANTARADGPDDDELRKITELIAKQKGEYQVKLQDNDNLSVPDDPKEGIDYRMEFDYSNVETSETVTKSDGVMRLYLPATDSHKDLILHDDGNLAIYTGDSYHIAVDASQHGFAVYVAISKATAPTAYEFDYELPKGSKLSEDSKGGIKIMNSDDEIVGVIQAPWAFDANGESVTTGFKLRDGMLVQSVEHAGAAYPVVADPSFNVRYKIAKRHMHQGEIDWCDASEANTELCIQAYGNHGITDIVVTLRVYAHYGGDGFADAFQHCYWSARMTIGLGYADAKTIGDLHEHDSPDYTPARERMDQWNNRQGRNLGDRLRGTVGPYTGAEKICRNWAANSTGPLQLHLEDHERFEDSQ